MNKILPNAILYPFAAVGMIYTLAILAVLIVACLAGPTTEPQNACLCTAHCACSLKGNR